MERGPGTGISLSFMQREAGGTRVCSLMECGWGRRHKSGMSSPIWIKQGNGSKIVSSASMIFVA